MGEFVSPDTNVAGGWIPAQQGRRSEQRRLFCVFAPFIVYKEAQTQSSNSEGHSLHQGHSG